MPVTGGALKKEMKPYLKYMIMALVTGILVFFPMMSNDLTNHADGLWHLSRYVAGNWEISLGRGLLKYTEAARFGIVSSAWQSVLSLLLIGAADCVVIRKFKLEGTFFSYLFIFLTIANPIVGRILSFPFTSTDYFLSLFLAVLAFAAVPEPGDGRLKTVLRLIAGSVLFCLSMWLYQSYICVYAVLCVYSLLRLLRTETGVPAVLKKLAASLGIFALGGLLYDRVVKLQLAAAGVKMADYKGADSSGLGTIIRNLPKGIKATYKEFRRFYFKDRMYAKMWRSKEMITILAVIIAIALAAALIDLLRKSVVRGIIFAALVLIMPVAASAISLIAVGNALTSLMAAGLLFAVILTYTAADHRAVLRILVNAGLVMAAWFLVSAVENDQTALREGRAATQRIAASFMDRIEDEGLLKQVESVAIVGRSYENPTFFKSQAYESANDYGKFGQWNVWNSTSNNSTWRGIMRTLGREPLPLCSYEKYKQIVNRDGFDDMPVFPEEGYMQIIDGVLVVKVSNCFGR